MADHNISINVQLHDEDAIARMRELARLVNGFHGSTTINVRVNPDMSGLNRFISGLQTASTIANSIGSAFDNLSNFSGSIGNAFTGMSNMFKTDFLSTASKYLSVMATKAVTGSIGDMISRYDILTTFTPYMQVAGVSSGTANAALQRVNESILGLPIGLDEAAYRLRRYQMFLGDTKRATDLTIGLQNVLTAGGASESMKNTAYMQIERLLATGDLSTFRQWQSLITGLGVSSKFIADAMSEIMGYPITPQELTVGLNDGTIAVDDFLAAIELLGEDWSQTPFDEVPQFVKDMQSALDIYKGTIESWQQNIRFAIIRGGTNLIQTLNEVMGQELGLGIVDVLSNVRDNINDIFKAGGSFIETHPEMLQTGFDIVSGFLERVQGFDWTFFSENVVTNIGRLFEMLFAGFDALPPGYLEEFASFAITIAGPVGAIFNAVQGGLPFMLGVFQRFKDFDFTMLMEDITDQVKIFADLIERILNIVGDENMSKLLSIGLVWGKPIATAIKLITTAVNGLAGAMAALSMSASAGGINTLIQNLRLWGILQEGLHPGLLGTLGMGLGGAAVFGGLQLALTSRYNHVQEELKTEAAMALGLQELYTSLEQSASELESMQGVGIDYGLNIAVAEAKAERAKQLFDAIASLHEQLSREPEGGGRNTIISDMMRMVEELNGLYPDLSLGIDAATGAYDANTAAIMANKEAYQELLELQDKSTIAQTVANQAQANLIRARGEQRYWNARKADWDAKYGDLREVINAIAANPEDIGDIPIEVDGIGVSPNAWGFHANDTELTSEELRLAAQAQKDINEQLKLAEETIGIENSVLEQATEDMADFSKQAEDLNVEWPTATETITEEAAAQAAALEELKQAYEELGESARETIRGQIDLLSEAAEESETSFDQIRQNMADSLKQLEEHNAIISRAYEILENSPWGGKTTQGFAQVVSQLFESGEYKAAEGMVSLAEQWASLPPEDKTSFMRVLTGNFAYEAGVEEGGATLQKIEAFAEYGPDVANGLENISSVATEAAEGTEEFAGSAESAAGAAEDVATNTEDAKEGVNDLGGAASSKAGAMSSLAANISSVSGAASFAAWAVERLASAINSLHDKTITVNARVHSATISGIETTSHFAESYAEGGWAGTGPLIFGPNGTDTIPSYLSPGEFVVKRNAAKMFGPTFLEKVNGMDIGGAFDALMHNLARPAGLGYMPSVTFNRDNHAQVNNYFSGETGQGYSQRKAYKWASKL